MSSVAPGFSLYCVTRKRLNMSWCMSSSTYTPTLLAASTTVRMDLM